MTFAVKRILNHTYVEVPADDREGNLYDRRLLAANRIPGLLTCREEHLDGKAVLLFDVTSRQSLSVYLGKRRVTAAIMRTILTGILRAAENLEEYLLDPGHFVLHPEYVFLDARAEETGLIYGPSFEGDFFEGLKALAGVLMANVPEDDHEAILLGYRFCHELDSPARDVSALMGLLAGKGAEEAGDEKALYGADLYVSDPEGGSLYKEDLGSAGSAGEEMRAEETKTSRRHPGLYAAALAAGGLLLVVLIYVFRALLPAYPGLALPLKLSALLGAVIAAAVLIVIRLRKAKERNKSMEEDTSQKYAHNDALFPEGFSDLYVPAENEKTDLFAMQALPEENDSGPVTQILSSPAERRGRTARLIPKDREESGPEIRLTGAEIRIGKLPEAVDAVIASPVISRIHARVVKRENGWFLEDLNSRNGTYVNGKTVQPGGTPLFDGDEVRFADEEFIFRTQ